MAITLKRIKQLDKLTNVPNNVDVIVNDENGVTKRAQLSDVLSLNNIPSAALERLVKVANQTARFALTKNDVQNGDTVEQLDTEVMYVVIDDTKLNQAAGYQEYKVGTAAKAYADESGNNIKSNYASSLEVSNGSINLKNKNGTTLSTATLPSTVGTFYGVETTASGSNFIKTATISNSGFELTAGVTVVIKFIHTNTYSYTSSTMNSVYLNVNNTGDKQIKTSSGNNPLGTKPEVYGKENYYITYVYDGTSWIWQSCSAIGEKETPNIFTGTTAEWNALSTSQKTKYDIVNLTDDSESGNSQALEDLTNVETDTIPEDGDVLTYDLTTMKWENRSFSNLNKQILNQSVAHTGKNLLPQIHPVNGHKSGDTWTDSGIAWTLNNDGSITANGTATTNVFLNMVDQSYRYMLPKGNYILTGCPSGGASDKYYLYIQLIKDGSSSVSQYNDYGSGVNISLDADARMDENSYGSYSIKICNGATVSNIVFKPMIRHAYTDSTYEKYIPNGQDVKGVFYVGNCTTAADQQVKVVNVDSDFRLKKGVRIAVIFSNTNTYSSTTAAPCQLNVNSTDAKNIRYNGNYLTGATNYVCGYANHYIYYFFDGKDWVWDGFDAENNPTYSVITADQISAGTDTASKVVRADYLKNGIRNIMNNTDVVSLANLSLKVINIPSNSGYPKYLLLKDITTWYNSTTTGQKTQGFCGWIISNRTDGSILNYICEIKACVSYQKETTPSSSGGLGLGHLVLETTHSLQKPRILKDPNNKYYLAIRFNGPLRQATLFGTWIHDNNTNNDWTGYVGTWVNCADSNETLPSGYSVAIDGRPYSSPVKNITRSGNTFTATRQDDTTFTFDQSDTVEPPSLGFGCGICDTAAATTAKVVTLSSYIMRTGGYVTVKFTYDVPANATLNINNRGAKPIYDRGAAIQAGIILAGNRVTFIYNGSQYELVSNDRWNKVNGCWIPYQINQYISVNCNGSKTNATLLAELYAALKTIWKSLGSGEVLEITGMYSPNCGELATNRFGYYLGRNNDDTTIYFSGDCNNDNGHIVTGAIILRNSNCKIYMLDKTSSADTFNDYTNTVWSSPNTLVVRYNVLRKV